MSRPEGMIWRKRVTRDDMMDGVPGTVSLDTMNKFVNVFSAESHDMEALGYVLISIRDMLKRKSEVRVL